MYNFQVLGGHETVQGSFHTLISCARVEYEDGAPCSYHCTAEAVKALILYEQDQNDEAGADWAASREP